MDGIANVAREQQTKVQTNDSQNAKAQDVQTQKVDLVKASQESFTKINSKEDVQSLVEQLNNALAPMQTNLSFGMDLDDIFYVSVTESETNKMIRRFPAEQALEFLPKMKEVTGMLFDTTG